jgi:quinol---cytochrome c reductase iron-sulfur subunit
VTTTEPSGPHAGELSAEDLADRSDEELTAVGADLDGVRILHRENRFEPGSPGDRRAERIVAAFFLLTAVSALAFIVVFGWFPWQFKDNQTSYLYTPLLGLTMGLALLGIGGGIVAWGKLIIPHEEAVQERHDGYSPEVDRMTTAANLKDGLAMTGVTRRPLLRRSLLLGGGALGIMAIIPLGGLLKKPNRDNATGDLFTTPWDKGMHLLTVNGIKIRPEDIRPGGLETAFPDVPNGVQSPDGPIMLIRMFPDVTRTPRKGQEDYTWPRDAQGKSILSGAYIAFSKICTHLGCPTSLYEQETDHILCPCHQSQFDVPRDAKPIFGPATRSLPVLPLDVDSDGYFVARGPFREPIGPSFWERPDYD